MKFLVDAQLPRRLVHHLRQEGHDAVHTLDLPSGNATSDQEILTIAEREDRVVVTKDADFVETFILQHRPRKLLVITTGNINNAALEAIMLPALPAIIAALTTHSYIELSRTTLIIHM